ncbi:MAG: hypothetical protein HY675_25360 [Chloroflexi bacterium]|nr:hypothetical protein [Chloroflexota bacterium]
MMTKAPDDRRGAAGKVAAVHAQLVVVLAIVALQLWLITVALNEFFLGNLDSVWSLTIASGVLFLVALGVLFAHGE